MSEPRAAGAMPRAAGAMPRAAGAMPRAAGAMPTLTQRSAAIGRLLDTIPDTTTVSASNWLAPHHQVSLFGRIPLTVSRPDYVVVDTTPPRLFPLTTGQTLDQLDQARQAGYHDVAETDGVVLLRAP